MAIFSNTPREPEVNQMRRRTDHTSLSIIAKDLTVTGDLQTEGVVKIEGKVKGIIRANTQALVAPGALVQGDIHTAEAVIGGRVEGNVHATDRVEVQTTAEVQGDVFTRRIVVLEGGSVNGSIKMGSAKDPKAAPKVEPKVEPKPESRPELGPKG
ncbi:MAG: polymer-forming cytoskeletal protein [Gemmatimonadales bacterium]|jgi:cytoskeletal protein CcmA (bactofilin family)